MHDPDLSTVTFKTTRIYVDLQCNLFLKLLSMLLGYLCIIYLFWLGLNTQGLYRISSAKSKMEKLCQLFEAGSERVDLSDLPPHLISSCLKLYFRQVRNACTCVHCTCTCMYITIYMYKLCTVHVKLFLFFIIASRASPHILTLPRVPLICQGNHYNHTHLLTTPSC